MKYFHLLFLFGLTLIATGQSSIYQLKYVTSSNGKTSDTPRIIYYQDGVVFLSEKEEKIQYYVDLNKQENINTIVYEGKVNQLITPFSELPKGTKGSLTKEIFGYECDYMSYDYFSNKIDVWYTNKSEVKGSPLSMFLPNPEALVTQIIINGNEIITLDSITKVNKVDLNNNFKEVGKIVNKAEFEELKINSRFLTVCVFDNEIINFNPDLKPAKEKDLDFDKTYHFSKGSVIMKKIKITKEMQQSGYIFARLTCRSNGDAYDRTGSVFLISDKNEGNITILDAYQYGIDQLPVYTDHNKQNYQGIKLMDNYQPPVEIMRFFTSFGVENFNKKRAINNYDWENQAIYEQDITALFPNHEKSIWIGVFIGNYDSGGHKVSLTLDFHPFWSGEVDQRIKYIKPLFSTVNTMEMEGQNYGKLFNNDTLKVDFEIPKGLEETELLYTTTGHGGWGGGDEFNPKLNQIFIDGKEYFRIVPWRTDCATYRLYNPASGNFENGLSSSDLSRSNWCPATLTPPFIIPLKDLKPGKHQLEVVIDQGKDEGTSFSHWNISGVLCGKTKK